MKGTRILSFMGSVLLIFCLLTLSVSALEGDEVLAELPEEEWDGFRDAIPDEVKDRLPENSLEDSESFGEYVSQMSGGEYVIAVLTDILGVELGSAVRLFVALCGILMLSAVMNAVGGAESSALSAALRFCGSGALISAVIYTQYSHFEMLESFFERLVMMVGGMLPVTAGIWAMGGNLSTAEVANSTFYVMLTVCQGLWAKTAIPVCGALTVLGFCDAMTDELSTGKIMNAIKKVYNFILTAVMTVLLSSLAAQSSIAASADTAAARAARLVSGTVIPVVGGSVGETFRTVAGGVSYLKNVFGIGGIVLIALLALPTVVSVLLTRFVFLLSGGIADMLGCKSEARLLENLGEVYGCMLGVVVGVAVMFIMALCVFMRTVVAVA